MSMQRSSVILSMTCSLMLQRKDEKDPIELLESIPKGIEDKADR